MDHNDLRIGDAERERTMEALREHFAQGRLTHEELDERLDRTLAAKTVRDLAQVTADLPGQQPAYDEPASPYEMGDWHAAMHAQRAQLQAMRHGQRAQREAMRQARRETHRAARMAGWQGPQMGPGMGPDMKHWRQRRRGPHPLVPALFALMVVGLIVGGSGIFKVLLVLWLGAVLFSLVRRRFHHRG
ncbi:DUF1707 domain-containing protein [Nonomuraea sp. MG754425]|nr:DUF1707 domain-containing protein [Nonomuraea sp. MG754425]